MGNVHEVMQIEPWESGAGAAIAIEADHVAVVRRAVEASKVSYVSVKQARRFVRTPRGEVEVPAPARSFLEIQTGGKWGYDDAFAKLLRKLAPSLGRAVFYVQDEVAQAVIEYVLDGSALRVRHVENDSHIGLVLLAERTGHAEFACRELSAMLDGTIFFSEPGETSVRAKAVRALEKAAPDAWDTWWHRGKLLLARDQHDEAVGALRRAAELAPRERSLAVRLSLLHALAVADPEAAIADGPALAQEIESEPDVMFSGHARALEVLAELEGARVNAELEGAPVNVGRLEGGARVNVGRFRDLSFAALRKANLDGSEVLAMAEVLARSGELDGARDLVTVAVGLRPDLEADARAVIERART